MFEQKSHPSYNYLEEGFQMQYRYRYYRNYKNAMLRWVCGILLIIILLDLNVFNISYSQWISVPLPSSISSGAEQCCNTSIYSATNNNNSNISILTNSLSEGKNLVKIRIENDQPIIYKQLLYTFGNHTKSTYLAKQMNNEYKALINVLPPKTNLSVVATDTDLHSTIVNKTMVVSKDESLFKVTKMIQDLFKR